MGIAMQVTLYRIEHESHHMGPFVHSAIWAFMDRDYHTKQNGFPVPNEDGIPLSPWDMGERVCACESLRQLLKWFPAKVIRELRKRGYKVAVYKVDDSVVLYGRTQVVFDPLTAERVVFK